MLILHALDDVVIRLTTEYTADDGLRLIKYLGLRMDIIGEEHVFREMFAKVYGTGSRYDLVGTCWELYPVTPLHVARESQSTEAERLAFDIRTNRDLDFYRALQRTNVQEKLRQGISLDEVLNENNKEVTK